MALLPQLSPRLISLDTDLQNLNNATRISADPQAVANASQYYTPTGNLQIPVITTHGIGDPLVPVETEQIYGSTVAQAGHSDMLRQTYVNSAGHCEFSVGEGEAALGALNYRYLLSRRSRTRVIDSPSNFALCLEKSISLCTGHFTIGHATKAISLFSEGHAHMHFAEEGSAGDNTRRLAGTGKERQRCGDLQGFSRSLRIGRCP